MALSTDDAIYGGFDQVQHILYPAHVDEKGNSSITLYLPARTAVVLKEMPKSETVPEEAAKAEAPEVEAAKAEKPKKPRKPRAPKDPNAPKKPRAKKAAKAE